MKINRIIGFDAEPLFRKKDGIGAYTKELILASAKNHPEITFIGLHFSDLHITHLVNECSGVDNIEFKKIPIGRRVIRFFAEMGLWININWIINVNFDGFIYTNFVCLPWVSEKIPKSLVVHDLTYLDFPETMNKRNYHYLKKFVPLSMNKNNVHLFTISNFMKNNIKNVFTKDAAVAYPGNSINLLSTKNSYENNFLLFVGTLEPRKNIQRLIDSFLKLSKVERKNFRLFIVGRKGWNSNLDYDNLPKSIVFLKDVDDEKLKLLYANMYGLVFPSLYEGFGIPVLDAVIFKKPILTSEKSAMEEITTRKGAILVNPLSGESIRNGLLKLINLSDEQVKLMTQSSSVNIQKFNWSKTSEIILKPLLKMDK